MVEPSNVEPGGIVSKPSLYFKSLAKSSGICCIVITKCANQMFTIMWKVDDVSRGKCVGVLVALVGMPKG